MSAEARVPSQEEAAPIDVFGHPHSPWVQAVLLGLHDRRVPHALRTAPTLAILWRFGNSMPLARFDGSPWMPESAAILERAGLGAVTPEAARAAMDAWRGVFHRADHIGRFFGGFSRTGDPHRRWAVCTWRNFWRSFGALYFFLRLRSVIWALGYRDPDDFGEQFLFWENALVDQGTAYFGGEAPDTADFLLFGVIQCHASIPVAPLHALREDARLEQLRSWIGRMHERFEDYPFLYSGPWFEPRRPAPETAAIGGRIAYWTGLACMVLAAPITVPLAFAFMHRVNREFRQKRSTVP
ncbi:MAG: hypothetical protein AAGE01_16375 [Pseudomonadota bacterium]